MEDARDTNRGDRDRNRDREREMESGRGREERAERTERILTQCSYSNMSKCFRSVAPRTLCGELGKRISQNNDNRVRTYTRKMTQRDARPPPPQQQQRLEADERLTGDFPSPSMRDVHRCFVIGNAVTLWWSALPDHAARVRVHLAHVNAYIYALRVQHTLAVCGRGLEDERGGKKERRDTIPCTEIRAGVPFSGWLG